MEITMEKMERNTGAEKHKKAHRGGWRKRRIAGCALLFLAVVVLFCFAVQKLFFMSGQTEIWNMFSGSLTAGLDRDKYPKELLDLLEKNEETYDFVINYPENKDKEFSIDLSQEVTDGEIPLFLQWDERWGYQTYGSNMIALTGCGPTCLSMVYTALTKDTTMHPLNMAQYSEQAGYYTESGTSWSLMTEGAEALGLTAEELPLDEAVLKERLQSGMPIICSMRAGDFTQQGHFIVLTGVDKNGDITLNDPNSKKNSAKSWSYERLEGQIKNLWGYRY